MPLYRVQFEFNMDSGNPLDKTINTLHFLANDPAILVSGPILQMTTFYGSIDGVFSNHVNPAASWYRAYDLDDPEPRAPIVEENFTLGTTGTNNLPPELAIVVSYEAPQQSGEPQARRRGRFYVGPCSRDCLDTTTSQILTSVLGDFETAMQNLLDASQAATTWSWQVYSRANDASVEVMHAWVDNAWDIQRSRGLAATTLVEVT